MYKTVLVNVSASVSFLTIMDMCQWVTSASSLKIPSQLAQCRHHISMYTGHLYSY